jgi:hypothetical protein
LKVLSGASPTSFPSDPQEIEPLMAIRAPRQGLATFATLLATAALGLVPLMLGLKAMGALRLRVAISEF